MPPTQRTDLMQSLGQSLSEQATAIRDRRRLVEQRWLQSRRVWMNYDYLRTYMGSDTTAANYNIPAARKAAERTVVRGVKMLTPNVKWFEVAPMGQVPDQKLANVDKFMWYVLRKRIKSRTIISQLVRSALLYGLCHLKTSISIRNGQVWPAQRVIDPFAFYTFPETVADTGEAEVLFEDYLLSYEKYKTFQQRGLFTVEVARKDLTKPDWPYHLVERLAYQGITDPTANVDIALHLDNAKKNLDATLAGFASMTEMWINREDKWFQVYLLWNYNNSCKCVGFFQSQYDQPLYRSMVHRSLPGELYTNAMMADIDSMDSIQDDLFNMFIDAVNREQVKYAVSEQAGARNDTLKDKPGAIWKFADDPRMAVQMLAPNQTSTNPLRAWQIVWGLINSMGGSGTIAEGQPGRNMPRAGGAVSDMINLSLADIRDLVELIEQEVLTPGLSDIYKVATTFIPDSQLMLIPGGTALYHQQQSSILQKQHILGDYEFEWVGSLQSQEEQQRAQRMLIFLNMVPTLQPMLQQMGYTFNLVELIQNIWRYSLGERSLQDVVMPMQDMQQWMQQKQMEAAASGGGNGSNGASAPKPAIPGLQFSLPPVTAGMGGTMR